AAGRESTQLSRRSQLFWSRLPSRFSHKLTQRISLRCVRLDGDRLFGTVELLLQLCLGVLRQGRLEHGAAELAEGLHCLVGRDLFDHEEERRSPRLEQVPHLRLKPSVD